MNKTFYISDLFDVINNPQLDKENFTFSKDAQYPYFTRTENNNGILGYVEYLDEDHKITGNSLAVGMISMKFHYMTHDFYAGQFTKTLIPKFVNFDETLALFFISVLNKHSAYYQSYLVREFVPRVNNTIIELPVIENPNPDHEYTVDDIDWQYMRDRITELEHDRITELEHDRITELDAYLQATGLNDYEMTEDDKKVLSEKVEFTDILISELFDKVEAKCKKADFDKRKDTSSIPTDEFCIPLINAKLGDNGIMFYGRKEDWNTQSMCIDVIQNGAVATGKVYVQPQATAVLWDAYLIQPTFDDVTEHSLLYLARCIEKLTKERFSYEKKATWDRIKECFITIPIKSDGTPDFDYMERYIRAMEKVVIADVVRYKDKVIETMKKVAGE